MSVICLRFHLYMKGRQITGHGLQVSYCLSGDNRYAIDEPIKPGLYRFGRVVYEFDNGLIFSQFGVDKDMFFVDKTCVTLPSGAIYVEYERTLASISMHSSMLLDFYDMVEDEYTDPKCRQLVLKLIKGGFGR